jgi:hypothetical protein
MYWNRFDICEAYALAFEHCWGPDNDLYARYCKLTRDGFFKPGPCLTVETLTENGREIYESACERFLKAAGV